MAGKKHGPETEASRPCVQVGILIRIRVSTRPASLGRYQLRTRVESVNWFSTVRRNTSPGTTTTECVM